MVTYKRASTDIELHQILALQQQNLPKNLSNNEMATQGFLTVEHDFELLDSMNNACPHTIAIDNEIVVGYALSMHPKFTDEIKILRPMFDEIKKAIGDAQNFIIMGQVCVAKTHRGNGIFRELYRNMREFLHPDYNKIITEVDTKNSRSLNAHRSVGFKELHRYHSDGKEWSLIILEQ